MMSSKDLLDQAQISRATLNNYIGLGLIPKPEVKRTAANPGEALTTLGYFPDWALSRIDEIRAMKRQGLSMEAICIQLLNQSEQANESALIKASNPVIEEKSSPTLEADIKPLMNNAPISSNESLNLSIDKIPYPAYMMNYDCGLIWLNAAAQLTFFTNTAIPERAEDR